MPELIVAGFHRSGTSYTAQLLHEHGLFLGDDLLGVDRSNPYGHFEDREVVGIHNLIFRDNDRNWQVDRPLIPYVRKSVWHRIEDFISKRRAVHRVWGFKDPRVSLFLGLWRYLLPASFVVGVYRPYQSCVSSLHRRHAFQLAAGQGPEDVHRRFFDEPDLALRMWIVHNEALLRERRSFPDRTMLVSFESLAGGFPLVDRVQQRWRIRLGSTPTATVYDKSATRSRTEINVFDGELQERADQLLLELGELHEQ